MDLAGPSNIRNIRESGAEVAAVNDQQGEENLDVAAASGSGMMNGNEEAAENEPNAGGWDFDQEINPQINTSDVRRVRHLWKDILFSDKCPMAVSVLHFYGYFIGILITISGWSSYTEFGRWETMAYKLMFQIVGLLSAFTAAYGSFNGIFDLLIIFFGYQALLSLWVFFVLMLLICNASRELLFMYYTTEPFYNMKLVDQPFVEKYSFKLLAMTSEPVYEISLMQFRTIYMLIITSVFNMYTVFIIARKLYLEYEKSKRLAARNRDNLELQEMNQNRRRNERNQNVENASERIDAV